MGKAEGDQYRPPSQLPTSPPRHAAARAVRASRGSRNKQQQPVKTREQEEEEYLRRRRTDFMDDVSEETDYVKTFYENQKNPKGAVGTVYRRKRFDDLKSIQERKNDEKQIDSW